MNPLPPTLTGCTLWNEADTPRTHDLKHLRAKRVAYYESIGIIKGDASRNGSQQLSTTSQDTKASPSENHPFRLKGPQMSPSCLATGKKPLLQEVPKVAPGEAEQCQDQENQQGPWRDSHPTGLDLHLLADALVPETQKLRHVINWAQKFLSNPPEERGLKSPTTSTKHPRSNLCQSPKALGSKRNAHVRSGDSAPLLRGDQSSTHTDIRSCSLRPQDNFSEMALSSEFSRSFQKEGVMDSQSYGWPEATIRSEGEGRAGFPPGQLQQEDYGQLKYDRAADSRTQTPKEDEMFPERLGAQPQLRHTSEESNVLEEANQSPPRNGYFWTPPTDSSEEECVDEPGERKEARRRDVLGRRLGRFSGVASSPMSESTLLGKSVVPRGVSSSGKTLPEAEGREGCTGAMGAPVGAPKDVTVESKDDVTRGEDPIQRLPVGQLMPPFDSSSHKRKESDNVGFSLRSLQTGIKHKNKWTHATVESVGKTITGRVPRGGLSRQSSAKNSPPVITQSQFDLTHPENYMTPQTAGLSPSVSEGPLEKAVFHGHSGASVFRGPTAEARGTHSSTWFGQSPPPKKGGGSVQTRRAVTRQKTHDKKERTLSSSHPLSRNISKAGLEGSSPLQDVGENLSWSDELLHTPEQEASVLETYLYYSHMLNKTRSLSSKERNSSLPLQGPRLSESASVITAPGGKGTSEGASLARDTKERKDGCESDSTVESEGGTSPQGPRCVEEAAPEGISFWKPQGNYGKLYSATLKLTCRKTSCEGFQEMSGPACLSHKHGDVKLRFQSISRPSSGKAEERPSTGTYPIAYAVGKQVQISDCRVLEDDWLVALACRQPSSLTPHGCRHAGQAVTDGGMKRLLHPCGDVLQELNVTSCSGLGLTGDQVLLHTGALCSRLTAGDISWSGATDVGVMARIQGASSLQGLSINGCQITDKAIKALVKKHGNNLHKIEVFGCLALTPRSIGSLALQCPHLQVLNTGRVPQASEACLIRSLENFREVTALNWPQHGEGSDRSSCSDVVP